ncbi:EF-hand domain-containing protein 1 isoform X2 [Harpegnathos saltator]|uniref:EF-hand domain-containing protein 1 isoform X2 n=1 Tax=Harpegnathos saltator TaxID=610380 RepID=UPI00058EB828|nr:EF-hand domain-containing protein 1 isoform X2 [Harpegnathos saltator]
MTSLPLLPGYTFRDVSLQDYKLPHKLDILNGFPVVRDTNYGTGRRPTDVASAAHAEVPYPVEYDPSLTYGRLPRYAYRQFAPHRAVFAQKCLRFKAFFRQRIFNSPDERCRVRHVNIVYFLEDDTVCVIEPVLDNAGFQQGKLVRRERIPKNGKGDLFIWKDFNVGIDVCIYGVVYHITDCDPFTREFLTSQGVDVGQGEPAPANPYTKQRELRTIASSEVVEDSRRRFLEYDRMVLSFDATWNDDRYRLMYFLSDDTMAISEIREPNNGKDPLGLLLKRMRVPKDWRNLPPSWQPSVRAERGDPENVEYYTPRDFRVGEKVLVLGRCFLLHDCDAFTRNYYSDMLRTPQPSAIPLPLKIEGPAVRYVMPPHIDFGSPEDTYASCLSFIPKPPRRNVIRQLANFPKKLRYSARMDAAHPEDEERDFVLMYNLSDGTVQISELEKRNSGRREGSFLSSRLIPKLRPATGKDDPLYYTPEDLFIGARINVFNHRFVITGADLFVYRYVEANRDKFCEEVRENLRDYFRQQGLLRDEHVTDVAEADNRAQEAEDKRREGAVAVTSEDRVDASERRVCEFDANS